MPAHAKAKGKGHKNGFFDSIYRYYGIGMDNSEIYIIMISSKICNLGIGNMKEDFTFCCTLILLHYISIIPMHSIDLKFEV